MPGTEESIESRPVGVEDARDASSRESRGGRGEMVLSLEYPFWGILAKSYCSTKEQFSFIVAILRYSNSTRSLDSY